MQKQAVKFGARIETDIVTKVNLQASPFQIETENGNTFQAKSVIIATGASARKLNVPGEKEFVGRGVSYCETCDGFFFRNKEIAIVGGGDSALQEGLFLTKFASKVHIIHRRAELRAQKILQDRARENGKVNFIWNSVVREIKGSSKVEALVLENTQTHARSELPVQGIFVYVGHIPNTSLFKGQLEMNEEGYLQVDARLHTNIPGVFAAGESHDHVFRQAVVSAGYGTMAELEVEKFLAQWEHEHKQA
jgi:thioredoxin reductase (NADPH)